MESLTKRGGLLPKSHSLGLNPSINTFFDDVLSRDIFDWTERNFASLGSNLPSVNLRETDTKLEIDLAAPGMKKEDFKVEINNDMLIISSEKEERKDELNKNKITLEKSLVINLFAEHLACQTI